MLPKPSPPTLLASPLLDVCMLFTSMTLRGLRLKEVSTRRDLILNYLLGWLVLTRIARCDLVLFICHAVEYYRVIYTT